MCVCVFVCLFVCSALQSFCCVFLNKNLPLFTLFKKKYNKVLACEIWKVVRRRRREHPSLAGVPHRAQQMKQKKLSSSFQAHSQFVRQKFVLCWTLNCKKKWKMWESESWLCCADCLSWFHRFPIAFQLGLQVGTEKRNLNWETLLQNSKTTAEDAAAFSVFSQTQFLTLSCL